MELGDSEILFYRKHRWFQPINEMEKQMNRKLRRKLRLLRLCKKYGYREYEALLRRKLRTTPSSNGGDETLIRFNLSREEDTEV